MAALLSMMVSTVVVCGPLLLTARRFPVASRAADKCTALYVQHKGVDRVVRGKEACERNEEVTEHAVNEALVFITEHLPHLIGTAHG